MTKVRIAVWLVALVSMTFVGVARSATIFESGFAGTTGVSISTLPEWANTYVAGGCSMTVENNMARMHGPASWAYANIRADESAGVAKTFDPINETGNRFECTVVSVDSTDTTHAAMFRMAIGPQATVTNSIFSTSGQHLFVEVKWNKTTSALSMYLKSAVNTGGQNTGTIIHQFSDTVVDLDGGQSIRLALEVRDGAGEDVRMAYQKRIDGQWGEWTTSAWFDPTAAALGVNALASDWKNTWNESTYLYLEQNGRTSYTRTIYVDDVLVTGVPEPATMGLLLLGSMGVFVRRRTGR